MKCFCFIFFVLNIYSFVSFHAGGSVYPYKKISYFDNKEIFELNFQGSDIEEEHFKSEYTTSSDIINIDLTFLFFNSFGISLEYKNIKTQYYNYTGSIRPSTDALQFNINKYDIFVLGGTYRLFLSLVANGDFGVLIQLDAGATIFFEESSERLKKLNNNFLLPSSRLGYLAGVHVGILISSILSVTIGAELLPLHFTADNENFSAWIFPLSFSYKVF